MAPSQVQIVELPETDRRRFPRYPLPVLRLARLAVDERVRGQGAGRVLLRAGFALAHEMALSVGCVGVVVDAKPGAVALYERLGFRAMPARGARSATGRSRCRVSPPWTPVRVGPRRG